MVPARLRCALALVVLVFAPAGEGPGAVLTVGPGKPFARIEDAVARAAPGDTVQVFAQPGGRPYRQVAVKLAKPRITVTGVLDERGNRVRIDGSGYNYSGAGSVPRAIFQFDPAAEGGVLENFELAGARNDSQNGAGVRINGANGVTVRACHIHGNDMGIISNGRLADKSAADQRILDCLIESNGAPERAGYNHNLYLGGTSVLVRGCEIRSAVTGHNLKSRAHLNRIEACYIHDSANRELDLVDEAGNTDAPESHTLVLGCVIVKRANMDGNKTVIHFGQDGGAGHAGTIFLVNNTVVTPYLSPVVDLSAPGAKAALFNNILWNGGSAQQGQIVVAPAGQSDAARARGTNNWLSAGFTLPAGVIVAARNRIGGRGEAPPFVDPARGDYRLRPGKSVFTGAGLPLARIGLPAVFGRVELLQFRAPIGAAPRSATDAPDLGAYGAELPAAR
jgi:hypothetical protein